MERVIARSAFERPRDSHPQSDSPAVLRRLITRDTDAIYVIGVVNPGGEIDRRRLTSYVRGGDRYPRPGGRRRPFCKALPRGSVAANPVPFILSQRQCRLAVDGLAAGRVDGQRPGAFIADDDVVAVAGLGHRQRVGGRRRRLAKLDFVTTVSRQQGVVVALQGDRQVSPHHFPYRHDCIFPFINLCMHFAYASITSIIFLYTILNVEYG